MNFLLFYSNFYPYHKELEQFVIVHDYRMSRSNYKIHSFKIPLYIRPDGHAFGDKDGLLHRDNDLPAVIWRDGITKNWYKHGLRHRDNDLPATICWGRVGGIWYKNPSQAHIYYKDGNNYIPANTM